MVMPVYLLMQHGPVFTPELGFSLACAALVLYTHRGNVRRMRDGTEPRSRKLWLFGRGRA
jgi:glycerol-3-phosphate acyltransferase PlsY